MLHKPLVMNAIVNRAPQTWPKAMSLGKDLVALTDLEQPRAGKKGYGYVVKNIETGMDRRGEGICLQDKHWRRAMYFNSTSRGEISCVPDKPEGLRRRPRSLFAILHAEARRELGRLVLDLIEPGVAASLQRPL